jgi:hypothetical protein
MSIGITKQMSGAFIVVASTEKWSHFHGDHNSGGLPLQPARFEITKQMCQGIVVASTEQMCQAASA